MAEEINDSQKEAVRRQQGETYTAALDLMKKMTVSNETEVDDYLITVLAEKAEGFYSLSHEGLTWTIPNPGENQHIEVVVREKQYLRFVPNLEVYCRLLDSNNNEVGVKQQPFIWHPFLYHYGINWAIPGEADYTAEITIRAPQYYRHDEVRGKLFSQDITVKIGPIHLKPGRKEHGPE